MSPGLTTERVYAVLKAQIMAGERRAGERLDPAKLSFDFNASATPVRDALHQLLGERMVEAWPSQGFQVPIPTESGLRDLYAWNSDLLAVLMRRAVATTSCQRSVPGLSGDKAGRIAAFFDTMAAELGHSEHRHAVRQASDRLHRARGAEAAVFADLDEEWTELRTFWKAGRAADLRTAIVRYHRRRLRAVPQIVALIATRQTP